MLPACSRGRGTRSAGRQKRTKAAERLAGLGWAAWPLAGALSSGEPWAVMTALCHPATRATTHPHDLPSPFKEGRPQISALSPLIINRCDLPSPSRLQLRVDSIEEDAPLPTTFSLHCSCNPSDGLGNTASSASAPSTRARHDARPNTRVHKRQAGRGYRGPSHRAGPPLSCKPGAAQAGYITICLML